jgi:hypothetical protein
MLLDTQLLQSKHFQTRRPNCLKRGLREQHFVNLDKDTKAKANA